MDAVLSPSVSVRVDGRLVLRAELLPGGRRLREADGTEIGADVPAAALLDREDLRAATRPEGAELLVFREGERRYRLLARRVPGGAELLVLSPDGSERDAHEIPLKDLLLG
jgi:hypothetical protein